MEIILPQIPHFSRDEPFGLRYIPADRQCDYFYNNSVYSPIFCRSFPSLRESFSSIRHNPQCCSDEVNRQMKTQEEETEKKSQLQESNPETKAYGPWEVAFNYSGYDPSTLKVEVKNGSLMVEGRKATDWGLSYIRHKRSIPKSVSSSSLKALSKPDGTLIIRQECLQESVSNAIAEVERLQENKIRQACTEDAVTESAAEVERPHERRNTSNPEEVTIEDCYDDSDVD